MEGIYYIWIGETIESGPVHDYIDGEEVCFNCVETKSYIECITEDCVEWWGSKYYCDGDYDHIAFSLEEAMSYIPAPEIIYY